MYAPVKEVYPHENFTLTIVYANDEKRTFDMKPFLDYGIFKELKDFSLFKTVRPSFDTIEWSNEADIDPEILVKYSVPE